MIEPQISKILYSLKKPSRLYTKQEVICCVLHAHPMLISAFDILTALPPLHFPRDAVKGHFFLIFACSYSGHEAPLDGARDEGPAGGDPAWEVTFLGRVKPQPVSLSLSASSSSPDPKSYDWKGVHEGPRRGEEREPADTQATTAMCDPPALNLRNAIHACLHMIRSS